MYGSEKDIRHNLKVFFIDGVSFMPSMALISITSVIPYFLDELGATTFQIALAASLALICCLLPQPVFGFIASKSVMMHITFGKILLLQRFIFLAFVLLIPLLAWSNALLINVFLVFWGIFNVFVGSYSVFFTPLVIRLLPPDRRGSIRGIGLAIGSFLGVGMSALIPVILERILFPYNYMVIFLIGLFFLLVNATFFFFMRQSKDAVPNEPMGMKRYIKLMPSSLKESPSFRAMVITCTFLAIANSLLAYYTLYAIREFYATEAHIAALTGLAVFSAAIAHVAFGYLVDRYGPRFIALIAACLVAVSGVMALTTNSLNLLFVAWVFANLSNSAYPLIAALLAGEVSPPSKLPLYVGVQTTISLAISAVIVLVLAPVLENLGFAPLFATVLICALLSFAINAFILKKRMAQQEKT